MAELFFRAAVTVMHVMRLFVYFSIIDLKLIEYKYKHI